jgi:long-chain fatty acid transport protein
VVPGVGNLYNLDLDGDGDAWGYNLGLLVKPTANLRIGANYRSKFNLKIEDGDVEIRNINTTPFIPNPVPPPDTLSAAQVFGGTSFDTKGNAKIYVPATFALGVAYTMGRLTVEADADWTFWDSFSSLPIDIRDNVGSLLPDTNAPKNWNNVVAFRVGAEYRVTDPLALRAGFVFDPSPVPAETMGPELPDADKLHYAVGAGYKIGNVTIDGAFLYIDKKDRTVTNQQFSGTWTGDAWLAGLDVGYHF